MVETQILQGIDQGSEELEGFVNDSPISTEETPAEATGVTEPLSSHGFQPVSKPVASSTGGVYTDEVVATDTYTQSSEEGDDVGFDLERFWSLLRQVGYETW